MQIFRLLQCRFLVSTLWNVNARLCAVFVPNVSIVHVFKIAIGNATYAHMQYVPETIDRNFNKFCSIEFFREKEFF